MDSVSQQRLAVVNPLLRTLVTELIAQFWDEFHYGLRVTQGLRSWEEQEVIWLQGRNANGQIVDASRIVTFAQPGYSWHNFGLAVDVVPMVPNAGTQLSATPDWDINHPVWKTIVTMGENIGLYSGVHFSHPDGPHFQISGRFDATPDNEVRALYAKGGLTSVWDAMHEQPTYPGVIAA